MNEGVPLWISNFPASFESSDGRIVCGQKLKVFPIVTMDFEHFQRNMSPVYWIRAKEVLGWTPDLVEDSDEEKLSDDDSLEEGMKNLESENDCSNSFRSSINGLLKMTVVSKKTHLWILLGYTFA
ncbi:hypothetical protein Tco_0262542 [Tanacetum coccineum]